MENKTKFLLFILLQIALVSKAQILEHSMESAFVPPDLDFYIRERDPYFDAVCTAKDRCVTTCTADYKEGCVCFKDGTCVEQSVNRCHQCTDANVFAVFEGQQCPNRHPFICHHFRHHHHRHYHHRHHKRDHGLGRFCNVEKFPSCVCTENGDCSTKIIDLCNDCQEEKYLAVFVNSTCPDKSLQAVCNKSAGANPSPTTCNYPEAYLCQAQDKNSTICDLESASQGCVCYSNGNCVSEPVSACACQRPDIVSVFTGEFCPTNCTGTPVTTPEEQSEEGESKSSNEESTPENEENTEGESSVVLNNLEDEFSSKNPYRVLNCTLPGAYQCKNSDRNESNCSKIGSNSCICDNNGTCISVVTNKCNACSNSEIATIYENGFCPSNCSASTNGTNASTNGNNANANGNNSNTNGNNANTNGNNANANANGNNANDNANGNDNNANANGNNANANSNNANNNNPPNGNINPPNGNINPPNGNINPPNGNNNPPNGNNNLPNGNNNLPNGNNNPNNNITPETGAGGNAPVPPTTAVPAQNFKPNGQ